MKVTVVVPTHNRAHLLPLTLKTVLWQRGVDLEVVVIDDGSKTEIAPVIERFGDSRLRVVRHETARGLSAARNRGAAEARGKWLAFVDDDDLWAPDKLALQVAAAESAGVSWAYAGEVNVTLDLRVLGGAPPLPPRALVQRLPRANVVPGGGSGVLVNAQIFCQLSGFSASYRHLADWDLWLRLSRIDIPAVVSRPLVGYRVHNMNRSLDTVGMVAELDLLERRHNTKVDRVTFLRHVARVSRRAGMNREALRYYWTAAHQKPSYLLRHFVPDASRTIVAGLRARVPVHRVGRVLRFLDVATAERAHSAWLAEAESWVHALQRASDDDLASPVFSRDRPGLVES